MTPSPSGLIPAAGTARRLRALAALGWPPYLLRHRSGLLVEALMWADEQLVTADTAARAAALYDALCMRLGPDREFAATAGAAGCVWRPPEDIDRPTRQPPRTRDVEPAPLPAAERPAAVARLAAAGHADQSIAALLGVSARTVARIRAHLGLPPAHPCNRPVKGAA